MEREKVFLFAKAPRLGEVKTRLARSIGPAPACAAYRQIVEVLVHNLRRLPVEIRFSPDHARDEIAQWLQPDWAASAQGGGDLGERMHRAFAEAFAGGAERVVIIGSDCPEIQSADIRAAFQELKTHDVVVGPAVDGGYWLIALKAQQPALFTDIEWSSDQVLAKTLQRAKNAGLSLQLLRILSDIDTKAEWDQFRAAQTP